MNEALKSRFAEIERGLERDWKEEEASFLNTLVQHAWNYSIAGSIHSRGIQENWSPEEYVKRLRHLRELAAKLCEALHEGQLHLPADSEHKPRTFWNHQAYDLLRAGDNTRGIEINKAELTRVAAQYLGHPELQNNALDWYLLDAPVFAELDAFAYHVMDTRMGAGVNWAWIFAGKSMGKYIALSVLFGLLGFLARWIAAPALALYLAIVGHEVFAMVVAGVWGLYVLYRLWLIPFRWRMRRKAKRLLEALYGTYTLLGDSTISPRRLKDTLDKAASEGVVFDGAVFGLVDRMLARDPTAFVPTS